MEDLFFDIKISSFVIYLSIILFFTGNALKELSIIKNNMILLLLFFISIFVFILLNGLNMLSLFSSLVTLSLSILMHKVHKGCKVLFAKTKRRHKDPI
jgi:hypothetical protein